ncbi:MAG: hypothetical protein R3B70_14400 [Polyangiaceae bacterium]
MIEETIMDVCIDRDALNEAVEQVHIAGGDIARANPIFAFLRLSSTEDRLEIVASNSIVTATTVVPVKAPTPGALCVPLKLFRQAIEVLPRGDLRLQCREDDGERNRLVLTAPGWSLALSIRSASDYPPTPTVTDEGIGLSSHVLRFLLARTAHAADKNLDRPIFGCVRILHEGPDLVAQAMDGQRVAQARTTGALPGSEPILLHQLACEEILRLLSSASENTVVRFGAGGDHLFVSTERTTVAIARLPGDLPEMPVEVSSKRVRSARVPRSLLLNALRASRKLTQHREVCLSLSSDGITVSSDPRLQEISVRDYVAGTVHGAPFELGANGDHLAEALGRLECDEVVLEFGAEPVDPISLRPTSDEDVVMIFMPMTLFR